MAPPLNIIWMAFWGFGVLAGFSLAALIAPLYIFLYIFLPCIPNLTGALKVMHKGLLLPYFASDNFMQARGPIKGFEYIYETSAPS